MKLLLDTHALLWLIEGNTNLSTKTKELIKNINPVIRSIHTTNNGIFSTK